MSLKAYTSANYPSWYCSLGVPAGLPDDISSALASHLQSLKVRNEAEPGFTAGQYLLRLRNLIQLNSIVKSPVLESEINDARANLPKRVPFALNTYMDAHETIFWNVARHSFDNLLSHVPNEKVKTDLQSVWARSELEYAAANPQTEEDAVYHKERFYKSLRYLLARVDTPVKNQVEDLFTKSFDEVFVSAVSSGPVQKLVLETDSQDLTEEIVSQRLVNEIANPLPGAKVSQSEINKAITYLTTSLKNSTNDPIKFKNLLDVFASNIDYAKLQPSQIPKDVSLQLKMTFHSSLVEQTSLSQAEAEAFLSRKYAQLSDGVHTYMRPNQPLNNWALTYFNELPQTFSMWRGNFLFGLAHYYRRGYPLPKKLQETQFKRQSLYMVVPILVAGVIGVGISKRVWEYYINEVPQDFWVQINKGNIREYPEFEEYSRESANNLLPTIIDASLE